MPWRETEESANCPGGIQNSANFYAGATTGNGHDRDAGDYPRGEQHTGRETAFYIYRDARSQPYLGIRKMSGAGRSQYPQFHWVGNGWKSGKPNGPKIPYRLPELLAAPAGAAVYIPEGEKDADSLAALGLIATTNSEGATPLKAKVGKWAPELNKWFSGVQRVFILADNDEVGREVRPREGARPRGDRSRRSHCSEFPDVPNGEDVTYWLKDLGHTKEELLARCEAAPQLAGQRRVGKRAR